MSKQNLIRRHAASKIRDFSDRLLGRGADIVLIDDPFGPMADAMSETIRDNVWRWFNGTIYNRLNPTRAASAFWRHCSNLKIGRPSSRESSSALSPRSRRRTTSRLRATLQRWPGARGPIFAAPGPITGAAAKPGDVWPVDSVDGLRPPSLTTGPSTAAGRSILFMLDIIASVSSRTTNGCPEKPGADQLGIDRRATRLAVIRLQMR